MNNQLTPGTRLNAGQSISSTNGHYNLIMQQDGNLVLYNAAHQPLWASNTYQSGATYAIMQNDGNLVVYNDKNEVKWASNTWPFSNAYLVLQENGNAVIYLGSQAIWSSNTAQSSEAGQPTNSKKWSTVVETPSGTALGGNITVAANDNGDWTYSGHMHDSGLDPYHFDLMAVIMTPSGIGYTLMKSGHTDGTSAGIFGTAHKDCDWTDSNNNPSIKANWGDMANAQLFYKINTVDKSIGELQEILNSIIADALKQAGQAAAKAIISLL